MIGKKMKRAVDFISKANNFNQFKGIFWGLPYRLIEILKKEKLLNPQEAKEEFEFNSLCTEGACFGFKEDGTQWRPTILSCVDFARDEHFHPRGAKIMSRVRGWAAQIMCNKDFYLAWKSVKDLISATCKVEYPLTEPLTYDSFGDDREYEKAFLSETGNAEESDYPRMCVLNKCRKFFVDWCLQEMTLDYLPLPVIPGRLSSGHPDLFRGYLEKGLFVFIPHYIDIRGDDIVPVHNEITLRSREIRDASQLSGYTVPTQETPDRYERIFLYICYASIITSRRSHVFKHGSKTLFYKAFKEWMGISETEFKNMRKIISPAKENLKEFGFSNF